ncbi:MAG: hypothetical protein EOP38_16185 [Rubrivivax sp.]|nr:MAG: hypothetical protein EOP38_16185 [Rubrivivax sp.]
MKLNMRRSPRVAFGGLSAVAAMSLLAGCIESNTSPVVAQAETAPLSGSTWLLPDANAVGGQALKLSPRQGAQITYYPGAVPIASIALRLRTDGCPEGANVKYTVNYKASAAGSTLAQLGPVRTLGTPGPDGAPENLVSSPWVTVSVTEGLSAISQVKGTQGKLDIRQLDHDNTALPATCGLAIDQGALRGTLSPGFATSTGAGKPRFFLRTNNETNAWMDNAAHNSWNAAHYTRAEVHRPHSDQYLPWFNGGLVYFKSHAANGFTIPNPAWILKNSAGQEARINWSGNGCYLCQAALDIGNPEVRAFLIGKAKEAVAGANGKAYKGLWVDDVNMSLYLLSPTGQRLNPIDPRTGVEMTDDNWQRYMAEWMEALRAALPATMDIYHNAKYYVDGWGNQTYTTRQIRASTGIHLEGGFSDPNLGKDPWLESPFSVAALARYIQRIHAQGKNVIMDSGTDNDQMRDYGLAAFHIFSGANDMLSSFSGNRPTDWWPGYDIDLGAPTTAAPVQPTGSGLWRRDFANGVALLLQPTGQEQPVDLPRSMVDSNGRVVTQVRLKPRQAAVLTNLPSGGVGGEGLIQKPVIFRF